MNRAPVKEREEAQEKGQDYDKPPISYKNLQPSYIQTTQEALKETKGEMQFLGNIERS
jgi:hypothetical protein